MLVTITTIHQLTSERLSKNYQAQQQNLMKARDQKLAIVTEALQGIRQVCDAVPVVGQVKF